MVQYRTMLKETRGGSIETLHGSRNARGRLGIQPTGNTIEGRGINIAYFEDGNVIEEIACIDMLDLFQQLGVIERPGV